MRLFKLFLTFCLSVSPAAQQQAPDALCEDLLVPIHSQAEPGYGLWGAGSDYKVGFDGHFRFIPYLGPDYPENLPLAWHTESVRVGEKDLVVQDARGAKVGAHRYEYHLGGVTEAYDLASGGVEQTFLIPSAPVSAGALVVVGRVETRLHAAKTSAAHRPISFLDDDGNAIVEYGTATAVDAAGNSFPMTTSWDGERIRLSLDAASVAGAVFPLVVDPWILSSALSQDVGMVAIASRYSTGTSREVCFTRITSAGDHDAYGIRFGVGGSPRYVVFNDVGTNSSTNHISVARTNGIWIVAYEKRYSNRTELRLFRQPQSVTAQNVGTSRTITAVSGEHLRSPELGGSDRIDRALVVYDRVGAGTSTVRAAVFDVASYPYQVTALPALGIPGVEVGPAVSPMGGSPEWVVCWAQTIGTTSEIRMRIISGSGSVDTRIGILQRSTSRIYTQARVAGDRGRYMMTYRQGPRVIGTFGIRALMFDLKGRPANVLYDRAIVSGQGYANAGIAFDRESRSHWMACYRVMSGLSRQVAYARLGHTAQATRVLVPQTSGRPYAPCITYGTSKTTHGAFFGAYAIETSNRVMVQAMPYATQATQPVIYGPDCGNVNELAGFSRPSLAGDEYFTLDLWNIPRAPAVLLLGLGSLSTPLDAVGMAGCVLNVDAFMSIPAPVTPTTQRVTAPLPLSDHRSMYGLSLYTQWIWIQPGANALGVLASSGMRIQVW